MQATMQLWVAHGIKSVDVKRVVEFLDHCSGPGRKFGHRGKEFEFRVAGGVASLSRSTVLALAAGLVAGAAGHQKVTYEELWACSVHGRTAKPSPVTLRKFSEGLRQHWCALLVQCGLSDKDERLLWPTTNVPVALKLLGHVFDLARVPEAQFKLRQPRLLPECDGEPKEPIPLDGLEPGAWKLVGSTRSAEPRDKIALDYGQCLSREAFQIRPGDGCLQVQLVSKSNKLYFLDHEEVEFDVPRGGEFEFGDVRFVYWEGPDRPESATPTFKRKRKGQSRAAF